MAITQLNSNDNNGNTHKRQKNWKNGSGTTDTTDNNGNTHTHTNTNTHASTHLPPIGSFLADAVSNGGFQPERTNHGAFRST